MKKLTNEQLADMAAVISRGTRETVKQTVQATGQANEDDERIIAIASMCAAHAAALTITYLQEQGIV